MDGGLFRRAHVQNVNWWKSFDSMEVLLLPVFFKDEPLWIAKPRLQNNSGRQVCLPAQSNNFILGSLMCANLVKFSLPLASPSPVEGPCRFWMDIRNKH